MLIFLVICTYILTLKNRKGMNLKKKISFIALLMLVGFIYAQQGPQTLDELDQTLADQGQSIRNIITTVMDIIAGVFAVVGIIQLIQVFTSQGGDDKIKKSGNWMYAFIFVAVGWILIRMIWLN
jgi:uncharacterized membrane protein